MQETSQKRLCVSHGFYDASQNGKEIHLKEYETDCLAEDLTAFFDRIVDIERIKVGKRQTIDTLINEEALLFAKYLRNERREWIPRIAN
jgi:hypothetical protein